MSEHFILWNLQCSVFMGNIMNGVSESSFWFTIY